MSDTSSTSQTARLKDVSSRARLTRVSLSAYGLGLQSGSRNLTTAWVQMMVSVYTNYHITQTTTQAYIRLRRLSDIKCDIRLRDPACIHIFVGYIFIDRPNDDEKKSFCIL